MKTRLKYNRQLVILLLLAFPLSAVSSQDISHYLMKGSSLIKSGRSSDAVNLLTEAVGSNSDSRLMIMRAEAYMNLGQSERAIADLNSANMKESGSATYELARVYAIKGDKSRSLEYLESHFSTKYKRSEKVIMLDPAFVSISNTPEWRSFWKKERYTGLEKGISEIEFYIGSGKPEAAQEVLDNIVAIYPGSAGALYATAMVRNAQGRPNDAVKILTELIADDPDNLSYLTLFSHTCIKSGNYAGATTALGKSIALGTSDASVLMERAVCYMGTGEYEKASQDIERYLGYYPVDGEALKIAGRIKAGSGDNLGAIGYYSENIKLNPGVPVYWNDRANSYFVARSWELAVRDYTMSLDLDPDNADAWLNKGIALVNSGRAADACHDFRRALSLGNKKASAYISRYCVK